MAFTRYLGWILLPILVWSIGGAWIEGNRILWLRAQESVAVPANCDFARVPSTHSTPCILEQLALLAGISSVQTCLRGACRLH